MECSSVIYLFVSDLIGLVFKLSVLQFTENEMAKKPSSFGHRQADGWYTIQFERSNNPKQSFTKWGKFWICNGNIYTYVISCFISPSSKFGQQKENKIYIAIEIAQAKMRIFKSSQIVTTKSSTLLTQHVTICPLGERNVCVCVFVCRVVANVVVIVFQNISSTNEESPYLTER